MSERFGADARLRTRADYQRTDSARRVSGRYVTLVGRPNGRDQDRLGIVASRKIGGAVVRNRAKRRVRELFRRRPAHAGAPLDVVAIARSGLSDAPFAELQSDFLAALSKLRGAR